MRIILFIFRLDFNYLFLQYKPTKYIVIYGLIKPALNLYSRDFYIFTI